VPFKEYYKECVMLNTKKHECGFVTKHEVMEGEEEEERIRT